MATKFELTRKFFNIRQETYASMEEYINDILMTVQKLADIDEQIEDKWISFVMRNGVSAEYESFVAALNQQLKEGSKSEDVKITLLGENERRRVKGESTSAKVLLSKQNKKNQRNKHKPGQKIKCYKCGDPTHKRPDCPKLNQDSEKKQKSKTQQVSMDQDTSKKNTTLLTKALTAKMSPSTWIIDSGATTHMAKDKDSLCDLDSSVRLPISVADDSEIKSEGVGKAVLKFKNCNSENVKTATDVLYVPNLSAPTYPTAPTGNAIYRGCSCCLLASENKNERRSEMFSY